MQRDSDLEINTGRLTKETSHGSDGQQQAHGWFFVPFLLLLN